MASSRARTFARRKRRWGEGRCPGTAFSPGPWRSESPTRRACRGGCAQGGLPGSVGSTRRVWCSTFGLCRTRRSRTSRVPSSTPWKATTSPMSEGSARLEPAVAAPLHVVATAGHVDHGKSSLILRLTGIDPDRWAEEKRRGLTIDLGFALCTLPPGRETGFVDVPGHERFVRNMLAGVGPVRLVLFVVAADEGWKPQSQGHLQILHRLAIAGAVSQQHERDLVEAARLDRVRAEVTERVRGTALEGVPIVACSSTTGQGFDELVAALEAMLAAAPDPDRGGRPRLHVDRVFSIRG